MCQENGPYSFVRDNGIFEVELPIEVANPDGENTLASNSLNDFNPPYRTALVLDNGNALDYGPIMTTDIFYEPGKVVVRVDSVLYQENEDLDVITES